MNRSKLTVEDQISSFNSHFSKLLPEILPEWILSCPFVADAAMITTQTEDHS